jgi:hypothetical protein
LPDDIEPWCDADEWIGKGYTMAELQERLSRISPPCPDFAAALQITETWFEVNGYVLEDLN